MTGNATVWHPIVLNQHFLAFVCVVRCWFPTRVWFVTFNSTIDRLVAVRTKRCACFKYQRKSKIENFKTFSLRRPSNLLMNTVKCVLLRGVPAAKPSKPTPRKSWSTFARSTALTAMLTMAKSASVENELFRLPSD